MSLLRPIIRACAVAALRNQTWAESRVYDSDMTPLVEAVLGKAAAPYICVYTDMDDVDPVGGLAELYDGEHRSLSVVVEVGVAGAIRNTKGELLIQFAATDEGLELAVDAVSGQAIAALIGNPKSEWGELFKRLIYKVRRMPSRRGGQAERGVRFAARRITFVCSTIYDVIPGMVPAEGHPVRDFIALARNDTNMNLGECADIVEKLLDTTAAPSWRQAQAYLGLTDRSVRELVVDGVPLPWPDVEVPPLDWSDTNEFVPPLTDIKLPLPDED